MAPACQWCRPEQIAKHFFFEKNSKKRSIFELSVATGPTPEPKVFWFFFSKKNFFLFLLCI